MAELARNAGMSRAVFAERFTRKVGMPPMHYLLEWRIAIAKDVLRREPDNLNAWGVLFLFTRDHEPATADRARGARARLDPLSARGG